MVYKFFDKKSKNSGVESVLNQLLENELHKPIIRKFKRTRLYSSFQKNIWRVYLPDMHLISKCNKRIWYLLCATDLFSKYARIVPFKDKKGITIVNAFQSILDSSSKKPNKIWVDQRSEFYNCSFKRKKENHLEMYSTYNEGKSVDLFIRTLKNKIYKHMAVV